MVKAAVACRVCALCLRAGQAQAAPALRSILWRLVKRALIAAAAGAATSAAALSVAERVHALPVEGPAQCLTLADGRRLAYEVRPVLRYYANVSVGNLMSVGSQSSDDITRTLYHKGEDNHRKFCIKLAGRESRCNCGIAGFGGDSWGI